MHQLATIELKPRGKSKPGYFRKSQLSKNDFRVVQPSVIARNVNHCAGLSTRQPFLAVTETNILPNEHWRAFWVNCKGQWIPLVLCTAHEMSPRSMVMAYLLDTGEITRVIRHRPVSTLLNLMPGFLYWHEPHPRCHTGVFLTQEDFIYNDKLIRYGF